MSSSQTFLRRQSMWLISMLRRKSKAPAVQPWLNRKQAAQIKAYRAANPAVVIGRIFIKDNGGSSWLLVDDPNAFFYLSLLRRFDNLPHDWEEVTEVALQLSGLNEDQRTLVRAAVTAGAEPGGCYTLEITREGYCFRDCIGDYQTVVVAEGTF